MIAGRMIAALGLAALACSAACRADIFVAEAGGERRIGRFGDAGEFIENLTVPDTTKEVRAVAVGPDGKLYASAMSARIMRYDPVGKTWSRFDDGRDKSGIYRSIAFGSDKNLYAVVNSSNWVLKFDGSTGEYMTKYTVGRPSEGFIGLSLGLDGALYTCDNQNSLVYKFDGKEWTQILSPASAPRSATADAGGSVYVALAKEGRIVKYSWDAKSRKYSEPAAVGGTVEYPNGLAWGTDGRLLVVGNYGAGVLRLDDAANLWKPLATTPANSYPEQLACGKLSVK